MSNLLSYCGLIDSKIRASDKDLPVPVRHWMSQTHEKFSNGTVWTNQNILSHFPLTQKIKISWIMIFFFQFFQISFMMKVSWIPGITHKEIIMYLLMYMSKLLCYLIFRCPKNLLAICTLTYMWRANSVLWESMNI